MMTKAVFIGAMTAVAAAGINTGTIDGWHNMAYVSSETNMGATEAVSQPAPVTETVYITTTCLATVTVTAQCETGEGPVETFPAETLSETVPNPVITTPIETAAVPPPVSTAIEPSIETSIQPTPSPPAAETAPPQFASASTMSLPGVSAVVAVLAILLPFVM